MSASRRCSAGRSMVPPEYPPSSYWAVSTVLIAAIVVPLGCLSNPRYRLLFGFAAARIRGDLSALLGLLRALAGRDLRLLGRVAARHLRDPFRLGTACVPSPPKPHGGGIAGGAGICDEAKRPISSALNDALFAAEVQSFPQGISAFDRRSISGLFRGLVSGREFSISVFDARDSIRTSTRLVRRRSAQWANRTDCLEMLSQRVRNHSSGSTRGYDFARGTPNCVAILSYSHATFSQL